LAYGVVDDYGYLSVREALSDGSFEAKELEFTRDESGWRLVGWGGGSGRRDPLTKMTFTGRIGEVVSGRVDNPVGPDAVHVWFDPRVKSAVSRGEPVEFGPFNHAVIFVPVGSETVYVDQIEGEGVPGAIALDLTFLRT